MSPCRARSRGFFRVDARGPCSFRLDWPARPTPPLLGCPAGRPPAPVPAPRASLRRVLASIEAGITLPTYKTQLCPYFSAHRVCPNGAPWASTRGRLSICMPKCMGSCRCSYPVLRLTSSCAAPPVPGLLCHHAHGLHELRREAAVQLGRMHPCYKTTLCDVMLATGRRATRCRCLRLGRIACLRLVALQCPAGSWDAGYPDAGPAGLAVLACGASRGGCSSSSCRCPAGDACQYAHGVADLRRHAAIRCGRQACPFGQL